MFGPTDTKEIPILLGLFLGDNTPYQWSWHALKLLFIVLLVVLSAAERLWGLADIAWTRIYSSSLVQFLLFAIVVVIY